MKLIITILTFMVLIQFHHYSDLDKKYTQQVIVNKATFQAVNEVMSLHAEAINKQTELLKKVLESVDVRKNLGVE